jgi:hypothetical protein
MKKTIEKEENIFQDDPQFEEILKLTKESCAITEEPQYFNVEVPYEVEVCFYVENGRIQIESWVQDVDTSDAETEVENLPEVEKIVQQLAKLVQEMDKLARTLAKEYNEDKDDILYEAEEIVYSVTNNDANAKRYKKQYKNVFKK